MAIDPGKWTEKEANQALAQLLEATIERDKAVAERDSKVAAIDLRFHEPINRSTAEIEVLERQLEQYYTAHKPKSGVLQLTCGELGIRLATTPALEPLNDKWTWEKIEAAVKRAFRSRFFHKPKPPGIDKNKVKRELPPEKLAKYGMKLETSQTFYIELKRLEKAA